LKPAPGSSERARTAPELRTKRASVDAAIARIVRVPVASLELAWDVRSGLGIAR
jgi:hypothetical protein